MRAAARRTHPVVFRPVTPPGRAPLGKPWPQVSYTDARSLKAAVAAAARRYYPDLTRADVTLAGSWREGAGQVYVQTPRGSQDLEFFPAAGGEVAA